MKSLGLGLVLAQVFSVALCSEIDSKIGAALGSVKDSDLPILKSAEEAKAFYEENRKAGVIGFVGPQGRESRDGKLFVLLGRVVFCQNYSNSVLIWALGSARFYGLGCFCGYTNRARGWYARTAITVEYMGVNGRDRARFGAGSF